MPDTVRTMSSQELARAVWHRRKWLGLLVFAIPLTAIVAVARSLPNTYESTATVLVEHQQAPENAVGMSDVGQETWFRTIVERTLSRAPLTALVTQFDLYPELRQRVAPEAIVALMRGNIHLQFNGVRQPTGQDQTIAFSISYRGRDPDTVVRVTNALAALFVKENARIREQQTATTSEFLRAQLVDAKRALEDQDRRIIAFKRSHIGQLPEQQAVSLAALERYTAQARMIMDRRDALSRQLAGLPGSGESSSAQLARLRQELADLRTRETEAHPDVVRLKREIADLEAQVRTGGDGRAAETDPRAAAVQTELAALRSEEQAVQRSIASYEERVQSAPVWEQEFQQISRDYTVAQQNYQSLLQRYDSQQLVEGMNQHQGDQFRILDPAVVSRQPVGPHRARMIVIGLMASLGAAVAAVLWTEASDTSFHTVDDLRAFTSVPVLASIPPIITDTDARRRRRQFGFFGVAAALGLVLVGVLSSYFAHSSGALAGLLTAGRF